MALNIKNEETYRLVRELADLTGESLTEAVTVAVRERLEIVRDKEAQVQEMLELAARIRETIKPEYRGMTMEEIDDLIYDEDGLPK